MTAPANVSQPNLPPLSIRAWLRFDIISRILDELQPKSIVEVGCGQGALGARLATRSDYLGVEPDESSFRVAKTRIDAVGGKVLNGTDDAIEAGRQFDLACAFEVLEHIQDDAAALKCWERLIRPGGNLLLSVPAWQHRFGPMDENVGHFRRYSPDDLSRRLQEAGFADPRITVYGWPLGFALESVRNRIDGKKLAAAKASGATVEELTAASGRTFQPPNPRIGTVVRLATIPFRHLQRVRPNSGIGLIAVARKR
jgi:SAM-dependent methyltransferase